MSITIGIYDLFAYTIPGLFYLCLINGFFYLLNWPYLKITQMPAGTELITGILVVIAAYLVGHLLDFPAVKFCFRLLNRKKTSEVVLSGLKVRYPGLKIEFGPKDWKLMLVILRHRDLELSRVLDKYEADSIMFRNISFGSLLAAFLSIGAVIKYDNFWYLLATLAALVVCWMAFDRSRLFHHWMFEGIFSFAMEYGNNLKEVIEYNRMIENKMPMLVNKPEVQEKRKNPKLRKK